MQNIVIADCIAYFGHGGFVIGSNTDGGVKNISVKNCNFIGTDIGLRFKSARDRGGLVENIYIKNIYLKDIVNEAILFDTYYENSPVEEQKVTVTETTPRFEKFYLDSIYCVGAEQAVFVRGLPEMPVREINLSNAVLSADKGFESKSASNFIIKNVKIVPKADIVFSLEMCKDFLIENVTCPNDVNVFMKVRGKEVENIRIVNTDLSPARVPVEYGSTSCQNAVIWK